MRAVRSFITIIGAAGAAAAIASAPTAAAEPNEPNPLLPQCVDTGGSAALGGSNTECATPGNVQIDSTPAVPEIEGPWGDMFGGEGYFFP